MHSLGHVCHKRQPKKSARASGCKDTRRARVFWRAAPHLALQSRARVQRLSRRSRHASSFAVATLKEAGQRLNIFDGSAPHAVVAMPRLLVTLVFAVASAELSRENSRSRRRSTSGPRKRLVKGDMHRLLSYKSIKTSRESGRVHVNEFRHPIGGATVERCEVLRSGPNQFQMVVTAASREAPFGETFTTRVVVTLRRDANNCVVLGATSSVQWNAKGRPRILERQIKSAAEKGSVTPTARSRSGSRPAARRSLVQPGSSSC